MLERRRDNNATWGEHLSDEEYAGRATPGASWREELAHSSSDARRPSRAHRAECRADGRYPAARGCLTGDVAGRPREPLGLPTRPRDRPDRRRPPRVGSTIRVARAP